AEQLAGGFALVNAGAGAGVNHLGLMGIDDDGEDVGVVNHALVDGMPGAAAVRGLPRQVPGAGVNDVRILGVDGDRFDVLNVGVIGRRDELPALACVLAAE